ncbi:transketolase subunit B [Nocardioides exalbidus]|uniref:Transketolase subunit B n=1 Tax=Nocardioides exalbidus TaxID=402596 RepID=A0A1H4U2F3_9ACTN|nr:transketolase C-terminal domain-containing protein [Nocardioides exalbidus]SEC62899.1 transketolase subunit B [Nocardioides exalbidus]
MSRSQREVFGETLAELAAADPRVVVLDGDLATSTRADIVAEQAPDAFVQVGIAEQNMVGMAVGMATSGYVPWLSSFGVFLTHRAVDQVRMLVSQTRLPVRVVASYAGLLNGRTGKTHQDVEDLAIMRAMPHMTVLAPADEHEAEAMIRWAADFDGPVYLRLARDRVTPVFEAGHVFEPGRTHVVRDVDAGADVTLVSTGTQTTRVLAAADLLAARGIAARVLHVPTVKPLDTAGFLALLDESLVVTVEEHSVLGGLGGLVSEITSTHAPRHVVRLGLADGWAESAPDDFLLDRYGLSAERVAEQVEAAVRSQVAVVPA